MNVQDQAKISKNFNLYFKCFRMLKDFLALKICFLYKILIHFRNGMKQIKTFKKILSFQSFELQRALPIKSKKNQINIVFSRQLTQIFHFFSFLMLVLILISKQSQAVDFVDICYLQKIYLLILCVYYMVIDKRIHCRD